MSCVAPKRRKSVKRVDMTGQRFDRLLVLAMTRQGEFAACVCKCACGTEKTIAWRAIKNGDTRSCGCLSKERISAANLTHGDTTGGPSPEWIVWRAMHQRCEDQKHKSYKDYGGRGITICERWQTFEPFLVDMGRRPSPSHTLDRRENDGNYEPRNCRWATKSEQARNRRPRQMGQHSFGACS